MSGLLGCRPGVTECKYNNTRLNDFYWPVMAAINTVMIAASKQIYCQKGEIEMRPDKQNLFHKQQALHNQRFCVNFKIYILQDTFINHTHGEMRSYQFWAEPN